MRLVNALLLAFTSVSGLFAQSASAAESARLVDWVLQSTRADDPAILLFLAQSDTHDSLAIVEAIGRRKEPYFGDVVERLGTHYLGNEEFVQELLLRVLLWDGLTRHIPNSPGGTTAESIDDERVHANAAALGDVELRLQSYDDARLKEILLRVAPRLGSGDDTAGLLAKEGSFLLSLLRSGNGTLDSEREKEAGAYLDSAGALHDAGLRSQVLTLIEASRDASFVAAARASLRQ